MADMDLCLYGRSRLASYRAYLELFLATGRRAVPVRELPEADGSVVAHRHDVDHSLELALIMATIEAELGVRSTYYLLPPGDYGQTENYYGRIEGREIVRPYRLAEAASALQAMGHEVGLHNDFLQLSSITGVPVADLIVREREYFARLGVEVTGSAGHGSAFARQREFANYEIFAECHSGARQVGREVTLPDGRSLRLHSIPMAEVGLRYEAYFMPHRLYLSDVGSAFSVTSTGSRPDPYRVDDGRAIDLAIVDHRVRTADGPCISLTHADWWKLARAHVQETCAT